MSVYFVSPKSLYTQTHTTTSPILSALLDGGTRTRCYSHYVKLSDFSRCCCSSPRLANNVDGPSLSVGVVVVVAVLHTIPNVQ